MNLRMAVCGLIAATTLTACSSSDASDSGSSGSGDAASVSPQALIARFKAAKLPVGSTYAFTAETDPNHKLGRPGGYTAKVSWTDTRIKRADAHDTRRGSVERGGSIEQFTNSGDAKDRAKYIQSVEKGVEFLCCEYDYVVGNSVIRVSNLLTPKQASMYKAAADG
jgi:hypothetical protein